MTRKRPIEWHWRRENKRQKVAFDAWFKKQPEIDGIHTGFKYALSQLQKRCPVKYPIVLLRCTKKELEGSWGQCDIIFNEPIQWIGIKLSERLSIANAVDTLIHEWAHAMTADPRHVHHIPMPQHSREWGIAYAKCYRAAFGEADRCSSEFKMIQRQHDQGRVYFGHYESTKP